MARAHKYTEFYSFSDMDALSSCTGQPHRNMQRGGYLVLMRKYYFDVRAGSNLTEDKDGIAFPDLGAAHEEALAAVLEIAKGRLREGLDAISVEVGDDLGRRVATLTASVTYQH